MRIMRPPEACKKMRENYVCWFQRLLRHACMLIQTRMHNACVSDSMMTSVLLRWTPSFNYHSKLKGHYTGCVTSVGPSLNPHSLS